MPRKHGHLKLPHNSKFPDPAHSRFPGNNSYANSNTMTPDYLLKPFTRCANCSQIVRHDGEIVTGHVVDPGTGTALCRRCNPKLDVRVKWFGKVKNDKTKTA
jgi:hypothetical protein